MGRRARHHLQGLSNREAISCGFSETAQEIGANVERPPKECYIGRR